MSRTADNTEDWFLPRYRVESNGVGVEEYVHTPEEAGAVLRDLVDKYPEYNFYIRDTVTGRRLGGVGDGV